MNLHAIVVNCIRPVHNTETCTIYQAKGQVNNKGVVKQEFSEPYFAEVDIQPLSAQDLQQFQPTIKDVKVDWKCYLHSTTTNPIAAATRLPKMRGGDFIKRANGRWLLVTAVMEDWRDEGWACVGAVEQLSPPDLG